MLLSLINEFAVLGTTFFLMAFGTLWYSIISTGESNYRTTKPNHSGNSAKKVVEFVTAFGATIFVVSTTAVALPFIIKTGFSPLLAALWAALFVVAISVPLALALGQGVRLIISQAGFIVLSLMLETAILYHWPW